MSKPPTLWYWTRYLPWSWQRELLRALAWPAYEVKRLSVVSDPSAPGGVRVVRYSLDEGAEMEAAARLSLMRAHYAHLGDAKP